MSLNEDTAADNPMREIIKKLTETLGPEEKKEFDEMMERLNTVEIVTRHVIRGLFNGDDGMIPYVLEGMNMDEHQHALITLGKALMPEADFFVATMLPREEGRATFWTAQTLGEGKTVPFLDMLREDLENQEEIMVRLAK